MQLLAPSPLTCAEAAARAHEAPRKKRRGGPVLCVMVLDTRRSFFFSTASVTKSYFAFRPRNADFRAQRTAGSLFVALKRNPSLLTLHES